MAADAFTFEGLGDLPGGETYSVPHGISADGSIVVGLSKDASGYASFRWTRKDGLQPLALPAGKSVGGISADGKVIFGWDKPASQSFVGSESEGYRLVGDLSGGELYSSAHAISADGSVVVGRGSSSAGTEAFVWRNDSGIVGLGSLLDSRFFSEAYALSADGTVIVGYSRVGNGSEAFRWTKSNGMVSLGDFPGGYTNGIAQGVSSDGKVVVGRAYPGTYDPATHEAFYWTSAAGMVHLGFAEGDQDSLAFACSADGNVIVGEEPFRDGGYALLWRPGQGMQHLQDVLANQGLDLAGWQLISARLLSNDGTVVVGQGINPNGFEEAWIATIPAYHPELSAHVSSDGALVLSWPAPSSGFILQTTSNLSQDSSGWMAVECEVSDDGVRRSVALSAAANPQFFRLQR